MKPKKTLTHTKIGTDTAKSLGQATTLSAAAAITGLSSSTIKSAQDAGCSAFRSNGRVDCDELIRFVETMPESADPQIDIRVERAKEVRAKRMLAEQKFQERGKLLWPIDKIRQAWARNVIATKTKLQSADNVISTECGMRLALSQEQIDIMRQVIAKTLRDALKELHAGEWGEVKCPECGKVL